MIINIKVIANAKRQEIKQENDKLKIYLKSKPEKGKANEELINLLASHFNVSKINFKILKGKKSRNKLIEIN